MKIYNSIRGSLFSKKYEFLKPGSAAYFEVLMQNEELSFDELVDIRFRRLRDLVELAFTQSTFYQRFYSEVGFEVGDLKSLEDVESLPILKRHHLVEHREDILLPNIEKSRLNFVTTGGSSGEPVGVYHPRNVNRAAALWRMKAWWGAKPEDDFGTVYRGKSKRIDWIRDSIVRWPASMIHLDASEITNESLESFVKRWNRHKPLILHGYVGGLLALAEYLSARNLKFHAPDAIWTTSAPLTKVQRSFFSEVFGGRVFDQYGCCEVFYLAAEGPEQEGLRVFGDLRHLEVVDSNGKGLPCEREGNVIVTDLENTVFPLIRYENGDRTALMRRPEECLHPYPLIYGVKGRQSERVVLPSGTILTGEYLTTIFDDFVDSIRQFRVHQTDCGSIEVFVVSRDGKDISSILETVSIVLRSKCGEDASIKMSQVEEIGHDRGKLRFITSDYRVKNNLEMAE